jgi:hypothetical protein
LLFALSGALLVLGAAILYIKKSNDVTRGLLVAAVSVALSGIGLRIWADVVLKPSQYLAIIRRSDLRSTRQRRLLRRRNQYSSPKFFRAPPYFIDFQERYVVSRPELDILAKRARRTIQGLLLLEGPPASGKSVLLRALEYELTRRRYFRRRRRIYTLNLKALMPDELSSIRSDLDGLRRRSVVLVDDVHLYLSSLGLMAQGLRGKRILLIFATRPLTNYPQEQAAAIRDMKPEACLLQPDTVADDIVQRYLQVNGVRTEGIEDAQAFYQPYKRDLWALSAALEASEITEGVPVISAGKINNWLISNSLRSVKRGDRFVNRSSVLAPLAALYRFEVVVARDFLVNQVGCDLKDIQDLVSQGEIVSQTDEFYALHHSSLADLLIAALSTEEGLGMVPSSLHERARRRRIRWHDAAVLWHVEAVPLRAIRTIVGVARSSSSGRELALSLLRRLDMNHFIEAIHSSATDIGTLGSFFELWHQLGRSLNANMSQELRRYVDEAPKQDTYAWAWASYNLASISPDDATRFVDVLAKLLPSEKATTIADVGTTLSYVSPTLAARALGSLDRPSVIEALRNQSLAAEELAKVFAKLVWVDTKFASSIDRPLLEVFPSIDASTLPVVLSRLAWGNPAVAQRLLEGCEPSSLLDLLAAADHPATRYRAFASMANVSLAVARSLVTHGAPLWGNEEGILELCNRILDDSLHDGGLVHVTPFPAELAEGSSLALVRARLSDILLDQDTNELKRRLQDVRASYPETLLLQALGTIQMRTLTRECRTEVASWAAELVTAVDARPDIATAHLRASGVAKGLRL